MTASATKTPRYRHVPNLSPRGRKLVLGLVLLLVAGVGGLFLVTTAPVTFGDPAYWIALLLWGVGGRLMLPMRVAIPGVRAGKKAILPKGVILVMVLAVVVMGANVTDPASPITAATAGFAGFWFGLTLTLAYMVPVTQRLMYCENCRMYRWAPRYQGRRYCGACGKVLEDARGQGGAHRSPP